MPRRKSNPTRPLYDEHGNWVEEHSQIKGAIRQVFKYSPQFHEVHQRARVELPPKTKVDGMPGKKNQVFYRCAECQQLFKQAVMRVDHINPVVPFYRKESEMSYDEIARSIFCKISNLQLLCNTPLKKLPKGEKSCHAWKTQKENWIRDRFLEVLAEDDMFANSIQLIISNRERIENSNRYKEIMQDLEKRYELHKEKQLQEIRAKAEKRKKLQARLEKIK